jgi:hypothetical protein
MPDARVIGGGSHSYVGTGRSGLRAAIFHNKPASHEDLYLDSRFAAVAGGPAHPVHELPRPLDFPGNWGVRFASTIPPMTTPEHHQPACRLGSLMLGVWRDVLGAGA